MKDKKFQKLRTSAEKLPETEGVYIFKDKHKAVLYVGKAINLRKRVTSYFVKGISLGPKTVKMLGESQYLTHIVTDSEVDALLLEAELIKRHEPKYNILLRDDKMYKSIEIQNEKVPYIDKTEEIKKVNLPKVSIIRKPGKASKNYYGPFPAGDSVNDVLKIARKIFKYRDCSLNKYNFYQKKGRPCVFGEIGVCSAPCVGKISPEAYQDSVESLKLFLRGKSTELKQELREKMNAASANKDYETAARQRDLLERVEYITRQYKKPSEYVKNPNLAEDIALEKLYDLTKHIPQLRHSKNIVAGFRIEAYDISNIQGSNPAASMVVATNGIIDKSEYKKFRIRLKETPDDFKMLEETLTRRFNNNWKKPNLILIDGGKGQVSSALKVLKQLNIKIPVIGIAKKEEKIIVPQKSGFRELSLNKSAPGLNLLQNLRDEAHRFALVYHRKLRTRRVLDETTA